MEIIQGSSDDESVLLSALESARSFFLVVPPSIKTDDVTEYYLRFTRPVCRAIDTTALKRILTVSGLRRGAVVNAGPVTASFAKDEAIEQTGIDFRALWCPGFMENMLRQLDSLTHQGTFFYPNRPDSKVPLVATRDIATSAATLLLDQSWTGQGGLAVLGPEDLSFADMAEIMTDVRGRPIRFQPVPAEAYKAQLIKLGASEAFAHSLIQMHSAKENGLDNAEPRTPENTTAISFREWCRDVLKPAMELYRK